MSPLDPVFWLNHCNIDRFWAEWQAAGNVSADPNRSYSNNFFDADGNPVMNASSTGALPLGSFDYNYDTLYLLFLAENSAKFELQNFQTDGNSLFQKLELTLPTPIGKGDLDGAAKVNVEQATIVEVPDLLKDLSDVRVFQAPEALGVPLKAVEPRRILARIEGVEAPKNRNVAVGVFVNCPYLSPDNPIR